MTEQRPLGLADVYCRLRDACAAAGSQSAFAQQHGISDGHVSDVMHARVAPGRRILDALGLVRIVRYAEQRKSGA